MSNQLVFESRRTRVWWAKAAAVASAAFVVAALALALFWGLCALLVALRDIEVTGAQWGDAWTGVLRAALMAAAAALGGYAVTMLFRNTIATLGLLFVAAVGSSLLISAMPMADPERWMLHANGLTILADGYTYWSPCRSDMCEQVELVLPMSHGLVYFGVALAVAVVASLVAFQRRDVP
ncbi:hypothetical protein [Nocardioides sp. AE5]|uniref:hypothetical protein n=1 Tax=Nocardioides sp. AE5 TaxID=2962573 RepID=UPI0028824F82|nr:hypothetical protein [Nocardioides sp. AE5]MDT0201747.1 hypothetical protein [Nocardioides sp. AE5]